MKYWLWFKSFVMGFFNGWIDQAEAPELIILAKEPAKRSIILSKLTSGKFVFYNQFFEGLDDIAIYPHSWTKLISKDKLTGLAPNEILNNLDECHLLNKEDIIFNKDQKLWTIEL